MLMRPAFLLFPCGILLLMVLFLPRFYQDQPTTLVPSSQEPRPLSTPTAEVTREYELPSDFEPVEVHRDSFCKYLWSTEYVRDISRHHIDYCQAPDSRSSLECFRHAHASDRPDKFCVARGVKFTPGVDRGFDLHCQERDWIAEAVREPQLSVLPQIVDFPEFFFWTGAGQQLAQRWNVALNVTGEGLECNRETNNSTFVMLVKRESNENLWHTMMEVWSAMTTIDILQVTPDPQSSSGRPIMTPEDVANLRIIFEDDSAPGPVYDFWVAINGKEPLRLSQVEEPECIGNVILPMAGSGNPYWQSNDKPQDCPRDPVFETFQKRVMRHMGIEVKSRSKDRIQVIIVERKTTRIIIGLHEAIEVLKARHPDVDFKLVDFGHHSLKKQMQIAATADVFLGVHGAGMTHVAFVPDGATLAEIYPYGSQFYLFRNLARMRGLPILTSASISEEAWKVNNTGKDYPKPVEGGGDDWQKDQIFMEREDLISFIETAIATQRHRGHLHGHFKHLQGSKEED